MRASHARTRAPRAYNRRDMDHGTRDLDLRTARPFGIARWTHQAYPRVVVRLRHEGHEGWGEAAPNAYYGETRETVHATLPTLFAALPDDPFDLDALFDAIERPFPHHHRSAKAALESAAVDLAARLAGVSARRLLGAPVPHEPTSFTVGLGTPDEVASAAAQAVAEGYPILKIKLGGERDEALLRALRERAPEVRLRVDANAAWSARQAVAALPLLEAYGVELLEQPVAAEDLEGLASVTRASRIPVAADESFRHTGDLRRLVVDVVNVKLGKVGGPRQAFLAMHAARALGFGVMLGCMVESSLGITAAAHVAGLADHLDLDGALLLAHDPYAGVRFDERKVPVLPDADGLGVTEAAPPA